MYPCCTQVFWKKYWCKIQYSSAPVSEGNTFRNVSRLHETADNIECYIYIYMSYSCNVHKYFKL
jgi:hypothetical protein